MIRFAGDLDGRLDAQPGGISHLKAQLAPVALAKRADSKGENYDEQNNTPKSAHKLWPSEQRLQDLCPVSAIRLR